MRTWLGFLPGSPRLLAFPFPLNLGHKCKLRAYIRSAVVFSLIVSYSKKMLLKDFQKELEERTWWNLIAHSISTKRLINLSFSPRPLYRVDKIELEKKMKSLMSAIAEILKRNLP